MLESGALKCVQWQESCVFEGQQDGSVLLVL